MGKILAVLGVLVTPFCLALTITLPKLVALALIILPLAPIFQFIGFVLLIFSVAAKPVNLLLL